MPRIAERTKNSHTYWEMLYSQGGYPTLDGNNSQRYEAAAHLHCGVSALDIGCGQGGLGRHLLAMYPQAYYVGVDHAKSALEQCVIPSNHLGRYALLASPWQSALGQLHGQFDTTYLLEIMEHMEDPRALLAHVAPYTARRLVVSVPIGGTFTPEMHRNEHFWDFTADELTQLLAPYGTVGPLLKANALCWVVTVDK